VVEGPDVLDRPIRELHRKRAVAFVEAPGRRAKCSVGVRVLLENAADDLVRSVPSGRRAHRRPRRRRPAAAGAVPRPTTPPWVGTGPPSTRFDRIAGKCIHG
jgi:hypothetical protein